MDERCKQCGNCCKNINRDNGTYITKEGYLLVIVNGRCMFLTEDNKCAIEENKPSVCKEYFCE